MLTDLPGDEAYHCQRLVRLLAVVTAQELALVHTEGPRDLFLISDNSLCYGCSLLFKSTCKSLLFLSMVILYVHSCSGALSSNRRQSRWRADQRGVVQSAVPQHLRADTGDARVGDRTSFLSS